MVYEKPAEANKKLHINIILISLRTNKNFFMQYSIIVPIT